VNPTKYTIDPAELQANQDYAQQNFSNEITVENPYKPLIDKVRIDYSEVDAFTILAECHIASKDKKQVIKDKKAKDNEEAGTPARQSLLQRMFSRSTVDQQNSSDDDEEVNHQE